MARQITAVLQGDAQSLEGSYSTRMPALIEPGLGWKKALAEYQEALQKSFKDCTPDDFSYEVDQVDDSRAAVKIFYRGEKLKGAVKRVSHEDDARKVNERC